MNKNVSNAFRAILLFVCFSFFQSEAQAQTFDNGIFFQALARDNYSNPAKDRKIYVQATIIQNTINGSKVLVEEFQVNTDASGVFGISIGKGTRTGGSISSLNNIDWSAGPYFLNLQISITPVAPLESWNYAKDWIDLGTTSFGTVPYALHAKTVAGFDTKVNMSDTAKMLLPYAKLQALTLVQNTVNTKLNTSDSVVKYVTPTQLANSKFDTTTLSNRIDLKANASDMNTSFATKVDKVADKGLSTNDYTTAEKTKLAAIVGTNTGDQDLSLYATNVVVDQLTSDVNNALLLKATKASPTFTGIVSGITKGMVGLGNVDNTADVAKPISALMQSALNLKANLISPSFITPALGVPTSGIATNLTGLPLTTGVTGVLQVANGGTGQQTYSNGQLLIGNNAGATLTKATLTPGAGISITNGNGSITIASTGFTGTGSSNYLPKFTGTTSMGNSLIYDNGTNVGIGTISPTGLFQITKDAAAVADQVEGVLSAGALTNLGLGWPGTEIWQTFTAGASGTLSKISFFTFSGSAVTLKIYSGSGVSGTLLYTSSPENFVYGSKDYNISGVDVVAGNTYTFQLTASASFQIGGVYTKTKSGSATVNPGYGSITSYTQGLVYATYILGAAKNLVFNGNLMVGTTTDDGVNMLQVNGNAKTAGTITAGAVTYPNTNGTSGQVLTANANGQASWASASGNSGPQLLTTAQRDALNTTTSGVMIFNTSLNKYQGSIYYTTGYNYNYFTNTIYGFSEIRPGHSITQTFTGKGQVITSANIAVVNMGRVSNTGTFTFAIYDDTYNYAIFTTTITLTGAGTVAVAIPNNWMNMPRTLPNGPCSFRISSDAGTGGSADFLLNAGASVGSLSNTYWTSLGGTAGGYTTPDTGHQLAIDLVPQNGLVWVNFN